MTATKDESKSEIAWRAVKKARQMEQPLTSFARALTGRADVRVVVGQMTATDGKTIYIKPPMKLGHNIEHNRLLCGRRDQRTSIMECPACQQLDEVFAGLYHEIAHHVADSFRSLSDRDRAELLARAVSQRPALTGSRYDKIRQRIEQIGRLDDTSYPQVCLAISPFLHPMVNALEDARVNRQMYEARTGTFQMFRAQTFEIMENGLELEDGTIMRWSDLPHNSQVIIGLLCKAAKYDYREWLAPEVVEALNDPIVTDLVDKLASARNVGQIYRGAFPLLERLRELGFCKMPDDAEDDPPPPPAPPQAPPQQAQMQPGDEEDEPEDGDAQQGGTADDDDTEPDDSDAGEDDDDTASGSSGDESDEDDESEGDDDESDGSGGSAEDDDTDADDDDADEDGSTGLGTDDDDFEDDDEFGDDRHDGDMDDEDRDFDDFDDFDDGEDEESEYGDDDDEPAEPEKGSADDALDHVQQFGGHGDNSFDLEEAQDAEAIEEAMQQAEHFDERSDTVTNVNLSHWDPNTDEGMWGRSNQMDRAGGRYKLPTLEEITAPEQLISGALVHTRRALADNKKAKHEKERRSGRVDSQRLASVRAGNTRVFSRSRFPGKRDYFILLGIDISGSTDGHRIRMIREMAMAIGDLLSRAGVEFAVYAHTGEANNPDDWTKRELEMYPIKERNEPWSVTSRDLIRRMVAWGANLDGHALEYFRKRCDQSQATDKLILYVTDGEMPADNYDDEKEVLERELKTCRHKGYEVVGVGIETDSPKQYGLETVHMDSVSDLPKLIKVIEKRLAP